MTVFECIVCTHYILIHFFSFLSHSHTRNGLTFRMRESFPFVQIFLKLNIGCDIWGGTSFLFSNITSVRAKNKKPCIGTVKFNNIFIRYRKLKLYHAEIYNNTNNKCHFNSFHSFFHFFFVCHFHHFVVVCLLICLFVFAICSMCVCVFFCLVKNVKAIVGATIWLSFIRLNRRQNIFDIPQLHIHTYTHTLSQTNGGESEWKKRKSMLNEL